MPSLYSDAILVERYDASPTAANLDQVFVAPVDLVVLGLLATVGTAPGGTDTVTVNISDSPTSQLASVAAYNLWSTSMVPTITGTAKNSFTTSTTTQVIENRPYALDYPLPGPDGTTGYETAQSTSQTTQSIVASPPKISIYEMGALVAPDETYTDFNSLTQNASLVHAGDVLTFAVGGTIGSAAKLEIVLFCQQN